MSHRGFGSDNHSGIIAPILEKLCEAGNDHQPSYGTDSYTQKWDQVAKKYFGEKCESHFVFNGTAANVLALSSMVSSYHSVLVAQTSHLNVDECGAPEKFIGCKLINVPSADGKINLNDLSPYLIRKGDQHFSQVKAISITQPTEYGTVYSLQELRSLKEWAQTHRLRLHMDGSRLFNAACSLNCTLQEMVEGFDVVSLGGTKNGLIFGEAVLFLNPELAQDFKFKRKQAMQLPSKTRFIAAQFLALFDNDLWLQTAQHVNGLAQRLAQGLSQIPGVKVTQKVQANAVFVQFAKDDIAPLREQAFFYIWNEKTFEARLMMSFDNQVEDVDSFLDKVKSLRGLS
jgi:threonine aldolase